MRAARGRWSSPTAYTGLGGSQPWVCHPASHGPGPGSGSLKAGPARHLLSMELNGLGNDTAYIMCKVCTTQARHPLRKRAGRAGVSPSICMARLMSVEIAMVNARTRRLQECARACVHATRLLHVAQRMRRCAGRSLARESGDGSGFGSAQRARLMAQLISTVAVLFVARGDMTTFPPIYEALQRGPRPTLTGHHGRHLPEGGYAKTGG